MKHIVIVALALVALAGLWYALLGSHEFNPPATFPVMDEGDIGKTTEAEPVAGTRDHEKLLRWRTENSTRVINMMRIKNTTVTALA